MNTLSRVVINVVIFAFALKGIAVALLPMDKRNRDCLEEQLKLDFVNLGINGDFKKVMSDWLEIRE